MQVEGIHPVGLIYFNKDDLRCIRFYAKRCLSWIPRPLRGCGRKEESNVNNRGVSNFDSRRSKYETNNIWGTRYSEYWSRVRMVDDYLERSREERLNDDFREAELIIKS